MPGSREKPTRVAIVGASSLRGKELKLVLEDRKFPAGEIILFDEPVLAGTLTEAAGEPTSSALSMKTALSAQTSPSLPAAPKTRKEIGTQRRGPARE
jgi:hypothetical protein